MRQQFFNGIFIPSQLGKQKTKYFFLLAAFLLLLFVGSLLGCANHKAQTQQLLSKDYQSLSDDNLTLYYYQLEDQIEIVEQKKSHTSISLGLGLGSFGRHSRGSGGVGITTGESKKGVASELRNRRNEVKLELRHRGITP